MMRRSSCMGIVLAVVVLLAVLVAGCGAQGLAGPQGTTGPQGAAGPAGTAGAPGAVPAGTVGASVRLTPGQATIGSAFALTVSGAGWPKGERGMVVVVGLDKGKDWTIRAFKANDSGAFSDLVGDQNRVPAAATPGVYTVKAVGEDSGTTATFPLIIVAPPAKK